MPRGRLRRIDTSRGEFPRRPTLLATLLALIALSAPLVAQAAPTKAGQPKVFTGQATNPRGTSATLRGSVDPEGTETSYYFQYGPSLAYGKQTTPGKLPAGTTNVKVGQTATGIASGYHYRIVASNSHGPAFGKDRIVSLKTISKAKFTLAKSTAPTVFGGPYVLSGTLTGAGNANRAIVLQASPYPFLEAFTTVGAASHTDALGRFSLRATNLTSTTQYRVSTLDPRPLYSPVVTQDVQAKVTLKVRSSGHIGLVRLYGTVTPAKPGAEVDFQLFRKVRPGNSPKAEEKTTRFATQFSSRVKRGTSTVSRFSVIVKIRRGGGYRAYVRLPKRGAIASGWSRSVLLHAAPASSTSHKSANH
jgi:hypothetical protein